MLLESIDTSLGGFVDGVVNKVKSDVSSAVGTAVNNVRTDVANGASGILAGAANEVGSAIAPAGRAPFAFSLTQTQIVIGAVALAGLVLFFMFRRRR